MARASAATTGFGTAARGAGAQVGGLAQSTGLMNKTLIGGAGAAFAVKKVADAAIAWESSFADVRKTVDGTDAELAGIADGLRGMSKEIPTSAGDLAAIAASAGQLGIQTPNVLDFTRVIADLGETTNLAGEQGAQTLARFANITGMAQGDFDRLGSTIVDLGNNFATTEAEIAEMAMRIAGAGSQIGLSEADILGLSTALSSVGINAEAGGSAISKVMIDIASEVATTGDKLGQFAEVAGMSSEQFATAWEEDAAGALASFITGLGALDESGGNALLTLEELGITEVRMRDALLRAAGAGDLLTEALDTGNAAWEENNALQKEAAQRYETTEAKVQIAKNAITDLATEIGEGLLPAIGNAAEALTDFLNMELPGGGGINFTEFLGNLNPFGNVTGEGAANIAAAAAAKNAADAKNPFAGDTQTLFATDAVLANEKALVRQKRGIEGVDVAARGVVGPLGELEEGYEGLEGATVDATTALENHIDWLNRSTDPVLALHGALGDVEASQKAYNDAVEEFGAGSDEAQAAAFALLGDVRNMEQAAIDGDLSWGDFEEALRRWVRMGVISGEEADDIRSRVHELRQESENYTGEYPADFTADTQKAKERIQSLIDQINRIPRHRNITVGFTSIGGGPVARLPGGGQILLGTGHSGGMVASSLPRAPWDAPDERTIKAQVGETIIPKHQPAFGMASQSGPVDNSRSQTLNVYGEPTPRAVFRARDMIDNAKAAA